MPIMRPLVLHYEKDETAKVCNDEFMLGDRILAAPVVSPPHRTVPPSGEVSFPLLHRGGRYLYVTPSAVSKWENGASVPDIYAVTNMADIFGVPVFILSCFP